MLSDNSKFTPSADSENNEILSQLLVFSEALASGDFSKRIVAAVDDSVLSKICYNLNSYADQRQISGMSDQEGRDSQLANFIEVISSFANRDFSQKLDISKNSNVIDAIATGINILGEELESSTVSKAELEKERDLLKMAKDSAEESSKAKTVFLGNLSHEIRTPLQGILGFSEVLLSSDILESNRKYVGIIMKRAQDLEQIIESLLDLATLEAGEVQANPEWVDLETELETIFNEYQDEYMNGIETVKLQFDNQLSVQQKLFIDTLHLKQVVFNLLNNSFKFTKEGSIVLLCKNELSDIVITVIDTGMGISTEKMEVIFEPFRQAHEGFSRMAGGIGLGLAICKMRVALWGGSINAKSEVDKGSEFSFTIPVS